MRALSWRFSCRVRGARARLLELLHEPLVHVRLPDPRQPFPLGRAPLRGDRARLRRGCASTSSHSAARAARPAASSRLALLPARRARAPRARAIARAAVDGAVEARAVGRGDLVRRAGARLASSPPRPRRAAVPRPPWSSTAASASTRGDRAGDALLVLLERRAPRRFRVVHGLDHRPGALGDRLVLGAVGEPFERGAIDAAPAAARSSAPTPASL